MKRGIHWSHRERLRTKYLNYGPRAFHTHEFLELMLFYSIPRKNTNVLAHELLNKYGTLRSVISADPHNLMEMQGIGKTSAIFLSAVAELVNRCNHQRAIERMDLSSTSATGEFAVSFMAYKKKECFYTIFLDSQCRKINTAFLCDGSIDEACEYKDKILEQALNNAASSVIVIHNHPGRMLFPSSADIIFNGEIIDILNSVGIEMLEHTIVGDGEYFSMADHGLVMGKKESKKVAVGEESAVFEFQIKNLLEEEE